MSLYLQTRTRMTILLARAAAALSTPAHAQWEMEESPTTASLRGIHNVGNGTTRASGTNGTVLRTEDGGYSWQTRAIPPGKRAPEANSIASVISRRNLHLCPLTISEPL